MKSSGVDPRCRGTARQNQLVRRGANRNGNLEKSLVPKAVIAEDVNGVAHVAELADALDSGSSE